MKKTNIITPLKYFNNNINIFENIKQANLFGISKKLRICIYLFFKMC